jgi:hypothetical protein
MEIRGNGIRFNNYNKWEYQRYVPYNYQREGLLKKLMSPGIVNTTNPILKVIIEFVENSLVFTMKYIDILKNFKNIYWTNR